MTDTTSISVIICTWDRCQLLSRTLDALERVAMPPESCVEILVVDNNSSDETSAVVRQRQGSWKLGQLRYLFEPRQGKQFALNLGIRNASKSILAFTDDDVLPREDWLANVCRLFSDSQVDIAGGKTLLIWPSSGTPPWFGDSMHAVVAGADLGDVSLCPTPDEYAPAGTNLICRRELIDRIGPFSESHVRHMDFEFGRRAIGAGAVSQYDPSLVVYTTVPTHALSKHYFRRWYFKLGIATTETKDSSVRMLGVPRWMWRCIVDTSVKWAAYRVRGLEKRAFECDVKLHQLAGYISATWHKHWFPKRHCHWVNRWSQKPGGTFS